MNTVENAQTNEFSFSDDGSLYFRNWLCVLNDSELK